VADYAIFPRRLYSDERYLSLAEEVQDDVARIYNTCDRYGVTPVGEMVLRRRLGRMAGRALRPGVDAAAELGLIRIWRDEEDGLDYGELDRFDADHTGRMLERRGAREFPAPPWATPSDDGPYSGDNGADDGHGGRAPDQDAPTPGRSVRLRGQTRATPSDQGPTKGPDLGQAVRPRSDVCPPKPQPQPPSEPKPQPESPAPFAHALAREPADPAASPGAALLRSAGLTPPAPDPAPVALGPSGPTLAETERQLRAAPALPDWPSADHVEAARRWYARLDDACPTGHGMDPRQLQRLAAANADVFVAAVDRMLDGARGWAANSALKFLSGSFRIVREDLGAKRDERMRGQGMQRRNMPDEPPVLQPPAAAEGWEDGLDEAHRLAGSALDSEGAERAKATAAAGQALRAAASRGAPADEVHRLGDVVKALRLPPVTDERWTAVQAAWSQRASPYDRRSYLAPLLPVAVDGDALVLLAPDAAHAAHVEASGWVEGLGVRWVYGVGVAA